LNEHIIGVTLDDRKVCLVAIEGTLVADLSIFRSRRACDPQGHHAAAETIVNHVLSRHDRSDPNVEPSAVTAAGAMIGPMISAMTI
jgi:hypothetical protein